MTASHDPRTGTEGSRVRGGVLTFGLMGGAVVWLLRLVANASLVASACEIGSTWPLWVSSVLAAAVAAAALVLAWRWYRAAGGPDTASLRWVGLLGVMCNVAAIAGIVLETVPVAVLDVCGP